MRRRGVSRTGAKKEKDLSLKSLAEKESWSQQSPHLEKFETFPNIPK